MWHLLMYPAIALGTTAAAGTYMWYKKPGIVLKYMLLYSLKKTGVQVKHVQGKEYSYCYGVRGIPQPDKPSLVLVHGFSASKDNWTPVVKRLPHDRHIILVDLLGHGDSSIPTKEEDANLVKIVDSLHELIHLIPNLTDRPFHMIGTSMGGLITATYSSLYPQEVCRATLICPAMKTPKMTAFMENMKAQNSQLLLPSSAEDVKTMMKACLYDKSKATENPQILLGVLQLRAPKEEFNKTLFSHLGSTHDLHEREAKFEEIMKSVKVPTQIIWGEDDELIHVSGLDKLKKLLPNIQRIDIIEKCGHAIHWDRPSKLVEVLLPFIMDKKTD